MVEGSFGVNAKTTGNPIFALTSNNIFSGAPRSDLVYKRGHLKRGRIQNY